MPRCSMLENKRALIDLPCSIRLQGSQIKACMRTFGKGNEKKPFFKV
jgi:hypothetical protein